MDAKSACIERTESWIREYQPGRRFGGLEETWSEMIEAYDASGAGEALDAELALSAAQQFMPFD